MGGTVRQFKRRAESLRRKKLQKTETKLPQGKKIPVMVAVPTLSGNVHWTIAHQFGKLMSNSVRDDCPWTFMTHVQMGRRPVEYCRNVITELFMHETSAEWLVMIDEDQIMPDNWYKLLLVKDADVVSGTTYCWVGNGYAPGRLRVNQYNLTEKGECFNIEPPDTNGQPYEVNVIGTGCIAIKRRVFNKIGCAPWHFTRHWNGRFLGSEDVNFSVACKRAGFRIAVRPDVIFGHMKTLDLGQIAETMQSYAQMHAQGKQHAVNDMLSLG